MKPLSLGARALLAFFLIITPGWQGEPESAPAAAVEPQQAGTDLILVSLDEDPMVTDESGDTAVFSVVLAQAPAEGTSVILPLSVSDPTEGQLSASQLEFTPENWDVEQDVTVTGVDDGLVDGDQDYEVVFGAAVSDDPVFAGQDAGSIPVTNLDDDEPSIEVSKTSLSTSEGGGNDSFTVWLGAEPVSSVTLQVTSSDTGEASVSPSQLTFTTENWDKPQQVIVTGVDDLVVDGNQAYTVTVAPLSGNALYQAAAPKVLNGTNADDDEAGITLSTFELTLNEGETSGFSVGLTSVPFAEVTVQISGVSQDDAEISASVIQFIPPGISGQFVTLTAVEEDMVDGTRSFTLEITTSSADPDYDGLTGEVEVTVLDNDEASLEVSPAGPISLEEGQEEDLEVRLGAMPAGSVTVSVTSSNPDQATVMPDTLTFNGSNWNVFQTVTVSAVADEYDDDDASFEVIFEVIDEPPGVGFPAPPVSVSGTAEDIDESTISIDPTILTTSEDGTSATFTVRLGSRPFLSLPVTIVFDLQDEAADEITLVPMQVTFTNADWGPKTVTVTGLPDGVIDGDQQITIDSLLKTQDVKYLQFGPPQNVIVTNLDIEAVPVGRAYTYEFVANYFFIPSTHGVLSADNRAHVTKLNVVTPPKYGEVTLNDDGSFTYMYDSQKNTTGALSDQFTYEIEYRVEGGTAKTRPATVTIRFPESDKPLLHSWVQPVTQADSLVRVEAAQQLVLEVALQPGLPGDVWVQFYRWDHQVLKYVVLQSVTGAPYRYVLDLTTLPDGPNQIYAIVYDPSGQIGKRSRILLLKQGYVNYVPYVMK